MRSSLLSIVFLFITVSGFSQVYYVNKKASGAGNGSSWQNAFTTLHDALDNLPTNSEIWVAEGDYVPYNGISRDSSFKPKSGMKLYGGFAGTETSRSQRDYELYKTIISGEAGPADTTGNIGVLMSIYNQPDTIVVDGFTFTGAANNIERTSTINLQHANLKMLNCDIVGNYSTAGNCGAGGIKGDSCSVSVINTKFRNNIGKSYRSLYLYNNAKLSVEGCSFFDEVSPGYANYLIYYSSSTDIVSFSNCVFSGNLQGTLYLYSKYSRIQNCTFLNNSTNSYIFYGGGDSLVIENSRFEGNSADQSLLYYANLHMRNTEVLNNATVLGYCFRDSTILKNCRIENNIPTRYSSGFVYNMDCDFKNCIFKNNSSGGNSPIVYAGQTSKLENCTFEGNINNRSSVVYSGQSCNMLNCTFSKNDNGSELGQAGILYAYNLYADGCTFKDGYAKYGGAYYGGFATIKNSVFDNNRATQTGGAIYCHGNLTLENTIVTNNSLDTATTSFAKQGGAMYAYNITAQNCIFSNNSGEVGAVLYCYLPKNKPFFSNCTFYNNFNNVGSSSAVFDVGSEMVFRNTILWNKSRDFIDPDSADVQFSILKNPFTGNGNISQDPGLDLNFMLAENSPAIDAGTPDGVINWDLLPTDIHGNARVVSGRIDIGATESQTVIQRNIVEGYVYGEFTNSCSQSADDSLLSGIVLIAEPGKYYAATDATGKFSFQLPAGAYTISPIQPDAKLIGNGCGEQSESINLVSDNETVSGLEFFYYLLPQADMRVQVSQSLKRPCMPGNSKISYWNEGNIEAKNVQVKMNYPSELIPQVIPVANIKNKNEYTFFVGDVKPGEYKEFVIEDSVKCIVPDFLGNLACIDVSVNPYYTGNPGSEWDLSEVSVKGECKADSALFEIANLGAGAMGQSSEYRLFMNDTLVKEGDFLIPEFGSVKIKVPSLNKVVRLEADQSPGFPFDSKPSLVLNNCGAVSISDKLAYSTTADQNVAMSYKNKQCQFIRGAYDPNDKSGLPFGRYESHSIPTGQSIEYRINFQNTGNDTAFTVVLKDTLSTLLDIASLKVLAASHNYSYTVSGKDNPVLTFKFANILLPDSNVNEPASHGYVIFRINPLPNLSSGTEIYNKAYIYFDYNPPIVTNETFHTINDFLNSNFSLGDDFTEEVITGVSYQTTEPAINNLLYPNPARNSSQIKLMGTGDGELKAIYINDIYGRNVVTQKLEGTFAELQAPEIPGIYLYEIQLQNGEKYSGKLMITK